MFHLFGLSKTYKPTLDAGHLALQHMREAAVRENQPAAVAAIDDALPVVARGIELQHAWDFQNAFDPVTEDTELLDAEIDAIVGQIHDVVAGFARRAKGAELGRLAARILADAFPKGLRRHIGASYREQAGLNARLVQTLRKPEYATFVAERGLGRLRDELAEHNQRFTALVAPEIEVRYADVVAARDAAQEAILRAVLRVGAAYDGSVPEQARLREVILLSFVELMDTLRASYRTRLRKAKARATAAAAKAAAAEAAKTTVEPGPVVTPVAPAPATATNVPPHA